MQRFLFASIALLVVALSTSTLFSQPSPPATATPTGDPASEPFPVLDTDTLSKSIVVRVEFDGRERVSFLSAEVVYSPPPAREGGPPLLGVRLLNNAGELLEEFSVWHPLWNSVHGPGNDHSVEIASKAVARLVFPFYPNIKTLQLWDIPRQQDLLTVDLNPTVRAFCEKHPSDPDCQQVLSPVLPMGTLRLDGFGDYLEVLTSNDLIKTIVGSNAVTIEAWVKRNATRCETVVGNGWRESFWLGFCNSTIRFYHTGYEYVDGKTPIPPGQWVHIAVTYDGTTRRYYVNGQLDLETQKNNGPITPGQGNLYIGADRHGGCTDSQFCGFDGLIDEVRIWNIVRSQAEIQADMDQAIHENRYGLLAAWHFDGDLRSEGHQVSALRGEASLYPDGFNISKLFLPTVLR